MTPEQKAALAAMLKELAPNELRVVRYEAKGGHKCSASTNLATCCGEQRCQACHIPHLKQVHGDAALYAYQKFVGARSLTWQVREYKLPLAESKVPLDTKASVKSSKVNKNRTTRAKETPLELASRLKDDDLDKVLAMLEDKLGRK